MKSKTLHAVIRVVVILVSVVLFDLICYTLVHSGEWDVSELDRGFWQANLVFVLLVLFGVIFWACATMSDFL